LVTGLQVERGMHAALQLDVTQARSASHVGVAPFAHVSGALGMAAAHEAQVAFP
jgi:hypothetical protein